VVITYAAPTLVEVDIDKVCHAPVPAGAPTAEVGVAAQPTETNNSAPVEVRAGPGIVVVSAVCDDVFVEDATLEEPNPEYLATLAKTGQVPDIVTVTLLLPAVPPTTEDTVFDAPAATHKISTSLAPTLLSVVTIRELEDAL
jgi:hypothetical protein